MAEPVPPADPTPPDEPTPPGDPRPEFRRGGKTGDAKKDESTSILGCIGGLVGIGLVVYQLSNVANAPPVVAPNVVNFKPPVPAKFVHFRVWDARTGAAVAEPEVPAGKDGIVVDAVFSSDGKKLAGAAAGKCLLLWDLAAPARPTRFDGFTEMCVDVALSDDATRVAGVDATGEVRVWNVDDPTAPHAVFPPSAKDGKWVPVVGFYGKSADRFWASDFTGATRVWDLAGAKPRLLTGFDRFGAYDDTPAGRFAYAHADPPGASIQVWDADAGKRRATVAPPANTSFRKLRFGPTGERIAAALDDGTVRVFDVAGGELFVVTAFRPGQEVTLASGDDGKRLYTVAGVAVSAWDFETGAHVGDFPLNPRERIERVERAGPYLIGTKTGKGDEDGGGAVVWRVPEEKAGRPGVGDGTRLWSSDAKVRFNRDGTAALRGTRLVDPATGIEVEAPFGVGAATKFLFARFSSDGNRFVGTPGPR